MLNMLFDSTKATPDGLFENPVDPPDANPLLNSKRWLRSKAPGNPVDPPTPFPGTFDPHDQTNWVNLERFNVLVPKTGTGHRILIRIAPVGVIANLEISYAVAFGRPPVGGGQNASPFVLATGAVRTLFIGTGLAPSVTAGGSGWIIDLGKIKNPPGPAVADLTNRYEFALGVIVKNTLTGVEVQFGEDPEEDVGG